MKDYAYVGFRLLSFLLAFIALGIAVAAGYAFCTNPVRRDMSLICIASLYSAWLLIKSK